MKRVPLLESFSFQPPIIDKDLSDPPGSPSEGERYIVKATGTGDWAGQENNIAEYNGATWMFMTPEEGWFVHVNDEDKFYKFNGTVWEAFEATGDMLKSVYDTGGVDGRVDLAEGIDDDTFSATAEDIQDAVTKKPTYNAVTKCLEFDV